MKFKKNMVVIAKMDPVTHGVIGLAISAFSGAPVALANPVSIGCALGAMSPDIDVLAKVKGDYVYLKHHRGISHSIPALAGLSLLITFGLSFFYSDFDFSSVLLWTFIGALSHTTFDILNSYGAKLLLPFTNKKQNAGLLMLYDPVVTILSGLLILSRRPSVELYAGVIATFGIYLWVRHQMKKKAEKICRTQYENTYEVVGLNVIPSLMAFQKWHCVVETTCHNIVIHVNVFDGSIAEKEKLPKPEEEILKLFEGTAIGQYIREFTPSYHVVPIEKKQNIVLRCIDLRYIMKNEFMHHATAVFDKEKRVLESFFHPYRLDKNIKVPEVEKNCCF